MTKILLGIVLLGTAAAFGADPYIGYLYPAGAQAGTRVRLLAGGQYLKDIHSGVISGGGVEVIKVTPVPAFPVPDGKQRAYLVQWLKNIESGDSKPPELPEDTGTWRKNGWWENLSELDSMSLMLVRKNLFTRRNPLQASPSINQLLIIDLEIAPDAEPGQREFRIWGRNGVSAPNLFFVDNAPHLQEPDFTPPGTPRPATPCTETFPAVLDGQILPGETDRFPVRLAKDKDYTFTLTGRKLHPFQGDAVPGHFQPALRLLDPAGKEAAFADDEYSDPDPVLRFRVPAAGVYQLEVRDNLYRGREDFVYRVEIVPEYLPYRFAAEPYRDETRASSDRILDAAERNILEGVLKKPGERAEFRFRGRIGDQVACEITARRFGSPLDGVLTLYGPGGERIVEADDSPAEPNVGMILQEFDPRFTVTLPANGEYRLLLQERTRAGGGDYRYVLRIGPPQPDFEIAARKSMLNLHPGATGKLKLTVSRTEGFEGVIRLVSGSELLSVSGKTEIPPDATEFTLSLKSRAKQDAPPQAIPLYAEAEIGGKIIRKEIIPADEFIQAFAHTHLLPSAEFVLGTIRRNPPRKDF